MSLRQALTALRRWWWVIAALAILGTGAGITLGLTLTKQYTASTAMLFSVNRSLTVTELAQGSTYAQGIVKSYTQVATLPVVLDPVIRRLGLAEDSSHLANRISVESQPDTVLMTISATDTSPRRAADIANAIADQLSREVVTLSSGQRPNAVGVKVAITGTAEVPRHPSFPNVSLLVAVGLVGGLVLGLALVGLLEVLFSPLLTVAAAERAAPVIGKLPRVSLRAVKPQTVRNESGSQFAEAVRILRTNLRHREGGETSRCLVVTSPWPGDGSSTVAMNLAAALSRVTPDVLLIDGDLRHASIYRELRLAPSLGLAEVLADVATLAQATVQWPSGPTSATMLDVLVAGVPSEDPSELFAHTRMRELVQNARDKYTFVIIDAPALLAVTDAALLASMGDGALLVARSGRTTERDLAQASRALELAGGQLNGIVLNGVRMPRVRLGSRSSLRWRR